MIIPPWINHPLVQRILKRLLDIADRISPAQRKRSIGFRLVPEVIPEIFNEIDTQESQYAWQLVEQMAQEGWIKLKIGRITSGYAPL